MFMLISYCRSEKGQQTPSRHNSMFDSRNSHIHTPVEENVGRMSPFNSRRHKSLQLSSQNVNNSQPPMNAWSHLKEEHNSDNDSTTSRSLPGSPTNSPPSSRKQANMPRAHSLENVSSDDGENKDDARNRNGKSTIL